MADASDSSTSSSESSSESSASTSSSSSDESSETSKKSKSKKSKKENVAVEEEVLTPYEQALLAEQNQRRNVEWLTKFLGFLCGRYSSTSTLHSSPQLLRGRLDAAAAALPRLLHPPQVHSHPVWGLVCQGGRRGTRPLYWHLFHCFDWQLCP